MSNREKLQGMIQTMPDDRIADVLAYIESIDAPPISNEAWRARLAQVEDDETLDAETIAMLESAEAEGGDPIPLEEVKRRYSL
jgi:hypothetical protein